jgi:broad specificity phosphatase PhoE
MNRLYLVRHGENTANLTKEFSYKEVDYSLTPKGVLQAQQTAEYFRDKDIHAIYSSPLKRAVETAEIIGLCTEKQVEVMETFREVNIGSLEGKKDITGAWVIHNQVLKNWFNGSLDAAFPDGENHHTLVERVRHGINQVTAGRTNRNILITAHGGLFTYSLGVLCDNCSLEQLRGQRSHNCSITEILVNNDAGKLACQLISFASTDHLSGDAANLISGLMEDAEERQS